MPDLDHSLFDYNGGAIATTLTNSITDIDISITVDEGSTLPLASDGRYSSVTIDRGQPNEECIYYSPRVGLVLQNCIRGADDTQAFNHAAGATVEHGVTAKDARTANELVAAANTWTSYSFTLSAGDSATPPPTVVPNAGNVAEYKLLGDICFVRWRQFVEYAGSPGYDYCISLPFAPYDGADIGHGTMQNVDGHVLAIAPGGSFGPGVSLAKGELDTSTYAPATQVVHGSGQYFDRFSIWYRTA